MFYILCMCVCLKWLRVLEHLVPAMQSVYAVMYVNNVREPNSHNNNNNSKQKDILACYQHIMQSSIYLYWAPDFELNISTSGKFTPILFFLLLSLELGRRKQQVDKRMVVQYP